MTLLGADRPGLVDLVAREVLAHGGNWVESRMCQLAGEFAGILRVQVPEDRLSALVEALKSLTSAGLQVAIRPGRPLAEDLVRRSVRIAIVGQDRPGILRQVSQVLARHAVNVEELQTECASAPMSGEPLFHATAVLTIPASCDRGALRGDLEKIAEDLFVDLTMEEVDRVAVKAAMMRR